MIRLYISDTLADAERLAAEDAADTTANSLHHHDIADAVSRWVDSDPSEPLAWRLYVVALAPGEPPRRYVCQLRTEYDAEDV